VEAWLLTQLAPILDAEEHGSDAFSLLLSILRSFWGLNFETRTSIRAAYRELCDFHEGLVVLVIAKEGTS
jgi:hypothetical protein